MVYEFYYTGTTVMAEASKTHLWINTAIAVLAVIASGGSAYFSYRTFNFSTETIGLSSTFTYDCLLSFGATIEHRQSSSAPDKPKQEVGLCWKLIISNQSNARISLVDFFPVDGQYQTRANMLTEDNNNLKLPLILDGGEARTLIVQIAVPGSSLLEKTIQDFLKAQTGGLYLADFAYFAAQNNLDALGNPIETNDVSDLIFLTFPADYKRTTVSLQAKTGRDNTFSTQLVFPPGKISVVSPSRDRLRQR
jgi:hypothetical protein